MMDFVFMVVVRALTCVVVDFFFGWMAAKLDRMFRSAVVGVYA